MFSGRKYAVFLAFCLVFAILAARLFYFMAYDGKNLAKAASIQRIADSQIGRQRGEILDRNGIPFTNRSDRILAVFQPLVLRYNPLALEEACRKLGLDFFRMKREMEEHREPVLVEISPESKNNVSGLGLKGVSFVRTLKRYDDHSLARHITGYLNKVDSLGQTGVERSFNDALGNSRGDVIAAVTDGNRNLVKGLGYRLIRLADKNRQMDVKLTLDYHIQDITERAMNESGLTGAAVVEDVLNGDIVAISSKPDFDQNNIGNYLNSPRNELFNRAVASYNLGSLFKIIDVAAALENGLPVGDSYFCSGSIHVGDKDFKCLSYERGGHGLVDLDKAFAYSCNPFFINMSLKLGVKNILDMSGKFGLGAKTGVYQQGIEESSGNLPPVEWLFSPGDTANISIGQGDIMATPLQMVNVIATIANGGIKNRINIVDSVTDRNGDIVREIRKKEGSRIISKDTSDRIRELMEGVMEYGTGSRVKLDAYGGAGGKTASAETGQVIDGQKVVHAWFGGYFPKTNPRYAMVVFIENGRAGGESAGPIFEKVAREILRKGL